MYPGDYKNLERTCPNCGYCPTCGRRYREYPYYPYYPYYSWDNWHVAYSTEKSDEIRWENSSSAD